LAYFGERERKNFSVVLHQGGGTGGDTPVHGGTNWGKKKEKKTAAVVELRREEKGRGLYLTRRAFPSKPDKRKEETVPDWI